MRSRLPSAITAAALLAGVPTGPAAAQSATFMGRIESMLAMEADDCSFRTIAAGTTSINFGSSSIEHIVFWVYSVDGCGGGNNWGTGSAAFHVSQPTRGPVTIKRIPLDDAVRNATAFSEIRDVAFISDPKPAPSGAFTKSVEIVGLSQGDNDARCCPTSAQQFRIWIDGGRIRATRLKAWTEKSNQ